MTIATREKAATLNYTEIIKGKITGFGANLVGIADIEPLKELRVDPPGLLDPFTRAVSIAIKLPVAVFEQIVDRPRPQFTNQSTRQPTSSWMRSLFALQWPCKTMVFIASPFLHPRFWIKKTGMRPSVIKQ